MSSSITVGRGTGVDVVRHLIALVTEPLVVLEPRRAVHRPERTRKRGDGEPHRAPRHQDSAGNRPADVLMSSGTSSRPSRRRWLVEIRRWSSGRASGQPPPKSRNIHRSAGPPPFFGPTSQSHPADELARRIRRSGRNRGIFVIAARRSEGAGWRRAASPCDRRRLPGGSGARRRRAGRGVRGGKPDVRPRPLRGLGRRSPRGPGGDHERTGAARRPPHRRRCGATSTPSSSPAATELPKRCATAP